MKLHAKVSVILWVPSWTFHFKQSLYASIVFNSWITALGNPYVVMLKKISSVSVLFTKEKQLVSACKWVGDHDNVLLDLATSLVCLQRAFPQATTQEVWRTRNPVHLCHEEQPALDFSESCRKCSVFCFQRRFVAASS